jgi:hypothetical protein
MHYTTIDPQKDKIRTHSFGGYQDNVTHVHFNALPGSHNEMCWFHDELTAFL